MERLEPTSWKVPGNCSTVVQRYTQGYEMARAIVFLSSEAFLPIRFDVIMFIFLRIQGRMVDKSDKAHLIMG